jgi:hypothetical protein
MANNRIVRIAIDIPIALPEKEVIPVFQGEIFTNTVEKRKSGGIITLFYCPERNICESFTPSDIDCEACVVGEVCPAGVTYDSDDYWLEIDG